MAKLKTWMLAAGVAVLWGLTTYGLAADALDPVVVTATRTAKPASQASASVVTITADEIAKRGATRLEEVLRDAVGVQVVSNGPAGAVATPSIRGATGSQVLVLLDGVRLNSAQTGQFNLSELPVPLSEIERIEVLRGPASALYGTNALGGVIQIFTRTPQKQPLTQLSWSEGRFNTRDVSFSTAARRGLGRYRLSASRERSDGYRDNSDLEQTIIEGMLGFDLPCGFDLQAMGSYLDKENGVPGSIQWPSPEARQTDRNTLASASLSGPVGAVDMTVRGHYDRRRNTYRDPGAFTPADDRHLLKTLGVEAQGEYGFERHSFLFGGDFYKDKLDSTSSGDPEDERWSLFAQYELEATSWATLLAGLRYDVHSDFSNEWSPRAALMLTPTDSTRVRFSASRAFRAPTLNDRFWPDTGWTRGNPDLDPETAWEYEAAVEQQLGERTEVSLAAFRREVRDLIEWTDDGMGEWQPDNVSRARIWGIEAGGRVQLHELLAAGANYTYLHPKNRDTGDYLENKIRHQTHLFMEIGPILQTHLRLDGRHLHYYSQPTRRHNSHIVLDAALSRPFMLGDGWELEGKITAKNLLDKDYESTPGYPMPPREIFVELTAYF
jgi:outer membrane cobalamin receptor